MTSDASPLFADLFTILLSDIAFRVSGIGRTSIGNPDVTI